MDIRNATQLASFLREHGFTNLDGGFAQLVNCIDNVIASCNCHKVEDKQRLYAMCSKLYVDAVTQLVPKFKLTLLSKVPGGRMSFYYDNGGLIAIVSR